MGIQWHSLNEMAKWLVYLENSHYKDSLLVKESSSSLRDAYESSQLDAQDDYAKV